MQTMIDVWHIQARNIFVYFGCYIRIDVLTSIQFNYMLWNDGKINFQSNQFIDKHIHIIESMNPLRTFHNDCIQLIYLNR